MSSRSASARSRARLREPGEAEPAPCYPGSQTETVSLALPDGWRAARVPNDRCKRRPSKVIVIARAADRRYRAEQAKRTFSLRMEPQARRERQAIRRTFSTRGTWRLPAIRSAARHKAPRMDRHRACRCYRHRWPGPTPQRQSARRRCARCAWAQLSSSRSGPACRNSGSVAALRDDPAGLVLVSCRDDHGTVINPSQCGLLHCGRGSGRPYLRPGGYGYAGLTRMASRQWEGD
jgi:hypothetical protein